MGASLFQGLGYGLATAGKGVGHAFQYANKNIPGGFRGAATRILTQDPTAGRPNPQQAQQDAQQGYTGSVARPPNSTLGLPSTSQQYDPGVAVKPVLVQPQQTGAAAWYQSRYGRPRGYAYDSRYPGSYPMDERYPGYDWRRGY